MNGAPANPLETSADSPLLAPLLHRLEGKPGFPALAESVAAINRITHAEEQNIEELSAVILRDFGLTSSILRVANSVTYRASSSGGISTVSRAVSVLGFATLRDIALTVVLFQQMQNTGNMREVKEAILRAQLAGTVAREAGKLFMPRKAEEIYTSGLFHSLGQILVLCYFAEEAKQIRERVDQQGYAEDAAAQEVLGLDFWRLGQAVATQWLFPSSLVRSLRPLPTGAIEMPQTPDDMLWILSGFGNEVSASLAADPTPQRGGELSGIRRRFAGVATLSSPQLHALVQKSFDDTKVLAGSLGVRLVQSSFAKRVAAWVDAGPDDEAKMPVAAAAAPAEDGPAATGGPGRKDAQQILSARISELSHSIVGDFVLDDIFRAIVETLHHAMDFQRVLMCTRNERSGFMVARMGVGKDADAVAAKFRVPLKDMPNVFHLAMGKGLDIIIKDISDPKIADKIPSWYRSAITAKTFALMPLVIKGEAVALIYCDKQQANSIVISERELSLMKTLRNQALLAIKQSAKS